jgi:hypothetical protein
MTWRLSELGLLINQQSYGQGENAEVRITKRAGRLQGAADLVNAAARRRARNIPLAMFDAAARFIGGG